MPIGDQEQHDECDVVVVGSGAGAMAAAFTAASAGAQTVLVEKTPLLGGTSAYSGAACWLPGSTVQQRAGIGDSTESARTYLRALLGDVTAEHQEAFLAHAPVLAEELEQDPAVEFEWRPFPDYFDAPGRMAHGRSFVPLDLPPEQLGRLVSLVRPPVQRDRQSKDHQDGPLSGGRALIGRLLLAFINTGNGTFHTGTCLTRLLSEHDRIVGVETESSEGVVHLRANRGVLLAAGGFEANPEMRAANGLAGHASWSVGPTCANRGDAISAAVDHGAALAHMDQAWWSPGLELPGGGAAFLLGLHGGFLVDGSGARFANESLPYDRMGRELAAATDRVPAYLVFDSRFDGTLPGIAVPACSPAEHLAAGTWVRADSLEQLAERIGLPEHSLTRTAKSFNAFAESGTDDEFGRGQDPYDRFFASGHGPNPCLVPVDTPPFYAARVVLSDLGTKGGLRTDARARVLRPDGTAVDGLYAAGNTSASLTGPVYPGPGIPIGTGMVFGSLAATEMANRAPQTDPGQ